MDDVQTPPFTVDANVVEPFAHIAVVPEIVPAVGAAVTVAIVVVVALTPAQLPIPFTV